jgi:hypothetical protein
MYKMSQTSRNMLAINSLKNICSDMLMMRAGSFPDKHIRQLIIKQFNIETGISIFDLTSPKSIDNGYFEFSFCTGLINGNRVLLTEKHDKTIYIKLKFMFQ